MKDIFYTIFKYKDKESPDTLGLYPERVHTRAFPERRYLWSSRMLVIVATISISINMILGSLLIVMLPQKTARPQVFHLNKDFYTLEQTQPAEKSALALDLIAESYIIEYIKLRYLVTQNKKKDDTRWQENSRFFWLSSADVYNQFNETERKYAAAQRLKGLNRHVLVEWVKPISFGLWQAQFVTYDVYQNKKVEKNVWRAVIRGSFTKVPFVNKADVIKNPYGFVISSFHLSYVGEEK